MCVQARLSFGGEGPLKAQLLLTSNPNRHQPPPLLPVPAAVRLLSLSLKDFAGEESLVA